MLIHTCAQVPSVYPEAAPTNNPIFEFAFFHFEFSLNEYDYIYLIYWIVTGLVVTWLGISVLLMRALYSHNFIFVNSLPKVTDLIGLLSGSLYITITENLLAMLGTFITPNKP